MTVEGYDLLIYIRVIEFHKFDALLGMDWLATYHAHVYCHHKVVTIRIPGLLEFEFRGASAANAARGDTLLPIESTMIG